MRNVLLTIKGLYMRSDTQDDIEFETHAELYRENGAHILRYETPEDGVSSNTKTTIRIENSSVALIREDEKAAPFVFEDKTLFRTDYHTRNGVFDMLLYPLRVHTDIAEDSGSIELEYTVSIGGAESLNKIDMHYMPIE